MKLLVASDLSARSDRALRRGLALAKAHGAKVDVVTVVDADLPGEVVTDSLALKQKALTGIVAAEPLAAEVEVTVKAIAGDPVETLPGLAKEGGYDLVVVGRHRARGFLDMLKETTVERLVRSLSTPVLLVVDPTVGPYERVLAPVAFSPACAASLRVVRELVPEAELSILHAVHIPFAGLTNEGPNGGLAEAVNREEVEAMKLWMGAEDLPDDLPEVQFVRGGVGTVIQGQIEAIRPSLIAVGAHTRNGPALFTLGGSAAELVRNPPCDVLLARP